MLGSVLQSAVFRGMWRDQVNGHINTGLLKTYSLGITIAPAIFAVPLLYFFSVDDMTLFIACGATFLVLNWNRLNVLVNGHILNLKVVNAEIIFVLSFFILAYTPHLIINLSECLIIATAISVIAKLIHKFWIPNV